MAGISEVKGIIFDYGGTIDSRGVHWNEIIFQGYENAELDIPYTAFREAYVYAERLLACEPLILPEYNFLDLMRVKVRNELLYLAEMGMVDTERIPALSEDIARYCYESARECVEEARPVLEALSRMYPMVMVSNFYGNLHSVLSDFDILKYFTDVIESAVVGVRKPDVAIFGLGVEALGLLPEHVVVIGDSYTKDIEPATELGCKTVWLKGKGWDETPDNECGALEVQNIGEVLHAVLADFN